MNQKPDNCKDLQSAGVKKRLLRLFLIVGGGALAGILYLVFCRLTGFGLPCMFHKVTGLLCPGCGLTRSIVALSRLDIARALSYHPLVFLCIAYFLWFGISAAVRYVRGEEDALWVRPAWLHVAVLVILLLFGILRNFW